MCLRVLLLPVCEFYLRMCVCVSAYVCFGFCTCVCEFMHVCQMVYVGPRLCVCVLWSCLCVSVPACMSSFVYVCVCVHRFVVCHCMCM